MKARLSRWVFGLSLLFTLGAMFAPAPAEAQVVVRVGPRHPRHYHRHYRHHRRPYRR